MDAKTHTTALVVIPPEELWAPVQAIRREHDRQVRRWMPHITLVYPFRPRATFDALAPDLLRACENIAPFRIRLQRIRYFHHGAGRYTVWLAPTPDAPLRGLRQAVARVVPDCDDLERLPGGYTPHLSVGQVRGRGPMKALRAQLQVQWQGMAFRVRAVSLVARSDPPDDVFRVERTIPFGARGGSAAPTHTSPQQG